MYSNQQNILFEYTDTIYYDMNGVYIIDKINKSSKFHKHIITYLIGLDRAVIFNAWS